MITTLTKISSNSCRSISGSQWSVLRKQFGRVAESKAHGGCSLRQSVHHNAARRPRNTNDWSRAGRVQTATPTISLQPALTLKTGLHARHPAGLEAGAAVTELAPLNPTFRFRTLRWPSPTNVLVMESCSGTGVAKLKPAISRQSIHTKTVILCVLPHKRAVS
jgi:hypothetical protein